MDEKFMKRCLLLARKGLGMAAPNPMVGALAVCQGIIIGEGYHKEYGREHAEVNAINSVRDKSKLSESTLYVNLEPCAHHGKTPPCTDIIRKYKIPKVVIGAFDDNPNVAGNGIKVLQDGGCKVIHGILEDECRTLNKRFYTFHKKKRPYVILKWAQTPDGFIAPEPAKQEWITGELSKKLVHKWRTEEAAILVGTNTVLVDNPALTAREWDGKNPIRILLDFNNRIDQQFKVFDNAANTLVYNSTKEGQKDNVEYILLEKKGNSLDLMMADLYRRGISSIIIEGGKKILDSFISNGLWDEARVFTGTKNFGSGLSAPVLQCHASEKETVGDDILNLYRNTN